MKTTKSRARSAVGRDAFKESPADCVLETVSVNCFVYPDKAELIRQKAYELYEQRGCRPGHDQEDWSEAEKIINEQLAAVEA